VLGFPVVTIRPERLEKGGFVRSLSSSYQVPIEEFADQGVPGSGRE
jgi:hypothetical protein